MILTRKLAIVLAPLGAGILALGACDADGVTPVCSSDGGECVTQPGDSAGSVSAASVVRVGTAEDDAGARSDSGAAAQ